MIGKRRNAIYCSRRCKTAASDDRRLRDGRAHTRDRGRYAAESDRRREYAREQSQSLRATVVIHYGDACATCESRERLELDHVHGNGERHRDLVGHGDAFYRYLLREEFPAECESGGQFELQVLCRSCHTKKTTRERRERKERG
jgi:hypothetical protein